MPRKTRTAVAVGDTIPEFLLPDQEGQAQESLSLLAGDGLLILFFFLSNSNPGCQLQHCLFRDNMAQFEAAGARVVGISNGTSRSHRRFARQHGLDYTLLADRGSKVRRLFGVPKAMGMLSGRATYVVGPDGRVLSRIVAHLNPRRHVDGALAALAEFSVPARG